jgi:tRNA(Ile)-lysidine synthase
MIKKVFKQIDEAGIKTGTRVLCAVSGGIDSSVMLTVLNDFGFDCIVAHCNFKLRAEESDGDEQFVRKLAESFEMKFLGASFDTNEYAAATGLSVQMAARELRYNWFNEMATVHKCEFIALAHNSDDQVETVITNLIRGTGVRGLTGMKFVKDNLFRPLLSISRKEIEKFATDNAIEFRTDSTNKTVKYSRNKIRHQVIPLLEEINSSAKQNILKSVNYLSDTEDVLAAYTSECRQKCLCYESDKIIIDLNELLKFAAHKTVLFEILIKEGIPKSLAADAINLLDSETGKSCKFLSITILRDRNKLIIDKNTSTSNHKSFIVEESDFSKLETIGIFASIVDYNGNLQINKSRNFAYLDYEKVKFPLIVRSWRDGDRFRPFGMKNFRKLSDFFKDEKLSKFDKESVKIVESDGKIVWIAGLRIDDRYRVSTTTKKVLILESIK